MAYIETVPDDAAEGPLGKIYEAARERAGFVAEILRVSSLHVDALRGYLALYRTVMFGESPLTRAQREMVATVVSRASDCRY
jgi:alkylhydroperoxidase family enzyme